jgi:hypothetical protein
METALPVSIHGVNYGVEPFSFVVIDPVDATNTGNGELVDSYAAGGTNCCYVLPKKWQPGIKVSVRTTHWVGKAADHSLHEVFGTQLVEVPRYAEGKPGELWVLRAGDGTVSVVSSDFQPDHPKWPGKVKGWPVPSLAYQRERWDLYIDHQMIFVKGLEELMQGLNSSPDRAAQEAWDHAMEYDKKTLAGFEGPADMKYRKKLKQEYQEGLQQTWAEVERLRRGRP